MQSSTLPDEHEQKFVTEPNEFDVGNLGHSVHNDNQEQYGVHENNASPFSHQMSRASHDDSNSPPSNLGVAMGNREHSFFKGNSHRSLFLRDLPFHFRDEHLREFIVSLMAGRENTVELCRIKYSAKHGKTLQVGFVMMHTPEDCAEIYNILVSNPRCCGRDLRVCYFDVTPTTELSQNGTIQFTFDADFLQPQITEEYVRENFEAEYGEIKSICIRGHFFKCNRQNGYGFILLRSGEHEERLKQGAVLQVERVVYHFTNANVKDREGDNQYYAYSNRSMNRRDNNKNRQFHNNTNCSNMQNRVDRRKGSANLSQRDPYASENRHSRNDVNRQRQQGQYDREEPYRPDNSQQFFRDNSELPDTYFQRNNDSRHPHSSTTPEDTMRYGDCHAEYFSRHAPPARLGSRDPYDNSRNSEQPSVMSVAGGAQASPGYHLYVVPVMDPPADVGYEMNPYRHHASPTSNMPYNTNMGMSYGTMGRNVSPIPNNGYNSYEMQHQLQLRMMQVLPMHMGQVSMPGLISSNPVGNRNMIMIPPDHATSMMSNSDVYGAGVVNYPNLPSKEKQHAYQIRQHQQMSSHLPSSSSAKMDNSRRGANASAFPSSGTTSNPV